LREKAAEVVDAYLEHSRIVQNANDNPYQIGSVSYDERTFVEFTHALHRGYSGLNTFERRFAEALDKTRRVWCRNPSMSGFGIPLLDRGETQTFHPDFLIWADKNVIAIDTKGDHLITRDAVRKLFFIEQIEDGPEILIRLITEGKWESHGGIPTRVKDTSGYSVWSLRQGKPASVYCEDASEAAQQCLRV
jgi:type III restriction enzyme